MPHRWPRPVRPGTLFSTSRSICSVRFSRRSRRSSASCSLVSPSRSPESTCAWARHLTQRLLRDAQILRQLRHRLVTVTHQLHRLTTKLKRKRGSCSRHFGPPSSAFDAFAESAQVSFKPGEDQRSFSEPVDWPFDGRAPFVVCGGLAIVSMYVCVSRFRTSFTRSTKAGKAVS